MDSYEMRPLHVLSAKEEGEIITYQQCLENQSESDKRSIYVGNVDYGSTARNLEDLFVVCGSINRISILLNKYDNHPKGYAYIEFECASSVERALTLHETIFRGRPLKVMPKRKNLPGHCKTERVPYSARPDMNAGPF